MLFSPRGASPTLPKVLKILLIANVAVFVVDFITKGMLAQYFSLYAPLIIYKFQFWRLATYMFFHDTGGIFHIFFNMLMLWMFGMAIIDTIGEKRFLRLYLTAGTFAGLCTFLVDVYLGKGVGTIGASGAVLAIVVLFALYYPDQELWFWGLFPIKAKWLVAIIVGIDVLFLSRSDGVSHITHLGGVLAGFLYFQYGKHYDALFDNWGRRKEMLVQRKREKEEEADQKSLEEVDEILKKISQSGMESLTASEKKKLEKASKLKRDKKSNLIDWDKYRKSR